MPPLPLLLGFFRTFRLRQETLELFLQEARILAAANLFFLPLASKMKFKIKEEAGSRMMIIMGLVGLAQGENPRLLQEKLEGFLPESERTKEAKK